MAEPASSRTRTGATTQGAPSPTERAAEVAWLREVSALTVAPPEGWPADEVAAAADAARLLAGCARALLAEGLVERGTCTPVCAACPTLDGTCDLVRDLAALPSDDVVAASVDLYRAALLHACSAVFVCRRTLHQAGACLFASSAPDLCGRVLAAAHRVG